MVALSRKKSWFLKWILKKRILEDISEASGYSKRNLQNIFAHYLDHPPVHKIIANRNCILLLDGTYFEKENCLIVYYDVTEKNILYWRYTTFELAEEIEANLRYLQDNEVNVMQPSQTAAGAF